MPADFSACEPCRLSRFYFTKSLLRSKGRGKPALMMRQLLGEKVSDGPRKADKDTAKEGEFENNYMYVIV